MSLRRTGEDPEELWVEDPTVSNKEERNVITFVRMRWSLSSSSRRCTMRPLSLSG